MRRVASRHERQHRLDDEPGRGAEHERGPAQPAQVEARAGRPAWRRPCPGCRRDQRQHEEDDEEQDGRGDPGAQERRASRPCAQRRHRPAGPAPIPIDGSTTRSGSRWCRRSMTASSTGRAGEDEEGRQLPATARTGAPRGRTAPPSRLDHRRPDRRLPPRCGSRRGRATGTGRRRGRPGTRRPARAPRRRPRRGGHRGEGGTADTAATLTQRPAGAGSARES